MQVTAKSRRKVFEEKALIVFSPRGYNIRNFRRHLFIYLHVVCSCIAYTHTAGTCFHNEIIVYASFSN